MTQSESDPHDPYLALRFSSFRPLLAGIFLGSFGQQMLTVALGWELYNRTGSALALGGIGLAQVVPLILLALPAGTIADRTNRKIIVLCGEGVVALAAGGLALISAERGPLLLVYLCLAFMGAAQAFSGPASNALVGQVVPARAFASASTWDSTAWQLSAVLGPAVGGFLVGALHGATWVYVLTAGTAAGYTLLLLAVRNVQAVPVVAREGPVRSLVEGIHFMRRTPILLAAITLDLFAVLLGGAVTLLPIFARDILHVGPFGLGWLQAASSLGAVAMAVVLTRRPPFRRAGRALLLAVAGFGLATIVFGFSRSFLLSLLMLAVLGALDNVSVVIRGTLVLTATPDRMRGRVASVNSLFIGTSNQLGGFESGLAAQLFGPVIAVVAGGVGTILIVLLVARIWPQMRRLGSLASTVTEVT